MSKNLDNKLVIGIASSALFDLTDGDSVYQLEGVDAYRTYQLKHRDDVLAPGTTFDFVKKLLTLNDLSQKPIVDVVLLSRNSPDTGYRVMNSIRHHGLNITRAVFTEGKSPYIYHEAFQIDLFLSENERDVREAIQQGCPAGRVYPPVEPRVVDPNDSNITLAFDFDAVLASDASERVYAEDGLKAFQMHEVDKAAVPADDGPIKPFFMAIAHIQKLEKERESMDPDYCRRLRTSIVTARNSPAEMRVLNTLEAWDVVVDDAFFLGGVDKGPVLATLGPDIFFDDQQSHIESASKHTMSAHVLFGVRNEAKSPSADAVSSTFEEAISGIVSDVLGAETSNSSS